MQVPLPPSHDDPGVATVMSQRLPLLEQRSSATHVPPPLHAWPAAVQVSRLSLLLQRNAGPQVPPLRQSADVWQLLVLSFEQRALHGLPAPMAEQPLPLALHWRLHAL